MIYHRGTERLPCLAVDYIDIHTDHYLNPITYHPFHDAHPFQQHQGWIADQLNQLPTYLRTLHQIKPIEQQRRISALLVFTRPRNDKLQHRSAPLALIRKRHYMLRIPRAITPLNIAAKGAGAGRDLAQALAADVDGDDGRRVVERIGQAALVAGEGV